MPITRAGLKREAGKQKDEKRREARKQKDEKKREAGKQKDEKRREAGKQKDEKRLRKKQKKSKWVERSRVDALMKDLNYLIRDYERGVNTYEDTIREMIEERKSQILSSGSKSEQSQIRPSAAAALVINSDEDQRLGVNAIQLADIDAEHEARMKAFTEAKIVHSEALKRSSENPLDIELLLKEHRLLLDMLHL